MAEPIQVAKTGRLGLNCQVNAMWRRSISCVCAGALMATAWEFFAICAATGWVPHKVVAASAITLGITGWVWLWTNCPEEGAP
jgi:hypothetical protein